MYSCSSTIGCNVFVHFPLDHCVWMWRVGYGPSHWGWWTGSETVQFVGNKFRPMPIFGKITCPNSDTRERVWKGGLQMPSFLKLCSHVAILNQDWLEHHFRWYVYVSTFVPWQEQIKQTLIHSHWVLIEQFSFIFHSIFQYMSRKSMKIRYGWLFSSNICSLKITQKKITTSG